MNLQKAEDQHLTRLYEKYSKSIPEATKEDMRRFLTNTMRQNQNPGRISA